DNGWSGRALEGTRGHRAIPPLALERASPFHAFGFNRKGARFAAEVVKHVRNGSDPLAHRWKEVQLPIAATPRRDTPMPTRSRGLRSRRYLRTALAWRATLREVAERGGWQVVEIYKDTGIIDLTASVFVPSASPCSKIQ